MNAQPSPEKEDIVSEDRTDLPVGEILRRTRVHYSLSLEDVSAYLRIRSSQLEAIEKSDMSQAPGRVYLIGYIRTYSEYLGLDGEKMVELFKNQAGDIREVKPELHFPVPASESKAPNIGVVLGSLSTLIVVIVVWMIMSGTGAEPDVDKAVEPDVPANMRVADVMGRNAEGSETTAPAVDTTAPEPVASMDPLASEAPSSASLTAPQGQAAAEDAVVETPAAPESEKQITITVKERSWVEVRDQKGKPILSRILKPGEVFIVPSENYGLKLDTGNAGGLEFMVNGQTLEPIGRKGDIVRNLVLDGPVMLEKYDTKER